MVEAIERAFPRLQGTNWRISSETDDVYNCIAWAAGVTTDWWWPGDPASTHWPQGITRAATLDAFRELFASLGYVVCSSSELEEGYQKIALFADDQGLPKHAARQLPTGMWTSKMGKKQDIEHALHDLEGILYGSVVLIMKRPQSIITAPREAEG